MTKKVIFVLAVLAVVVVGFLEYSLLYGQFLSTNFYQPIPLNSSIPLSYSEVYKQRKTAIIQLQSSIKINANCTLLFKGDKDEIGRVLKANKMESGLSNTEFYDKAKHCSWLTKEFDRQYYVSETERQFPLAFAITVYNAPQQIFRFLKIIYRKHNIYCIHFDKKSDPQFKQLMIQLAKCLPNVIVPSVIENVIWGWHTIVDAQMNCYEELLKVRKGYPWKYVVNLCGKEVPMRTNREMVHTLSKLNGTSAVELLTNGNKDRQKNRHILKNGRIMNTQQLLGSIPYNFTMQKSNTHIGVTEPFINFLLYNKTSITFRKFMDETYVPDEHYISTLFAVPGVPGGYDARYTSLVPTVDEYIWMFTNPPCSGESVHSVCVVNSGDLQRLSYRPVPNERDKFFHNKFFMEKDRTVIDCLEEELIRRNIEEFEEDYASFLQNTV